MSAKLRTWLQDLPLMLLRYTCYSLDECVAHMSITGKVYFSLGVLRTCLVDKPDSAKARDTPGIAF